MAEVQLSREKVVEAVESFLFPFARSGHPFSFTVDMFDVMAMELDLENADDGTCYAWPFKTSEAVAEAVLEALERHDYVGSVEADEFDADGEDWAVTIEAKAKEN